MTKHLIRAIDRIWRKILDIPPLPHISRWEQRIYASRATARLTELRAICSRAGLERHRPTIDDKPADWAERL